MKRERISDNKVRFTLDREDLKLRDVRLSELSYGSSKAKELFEELMELAREDLGYDMEAKPFMVEAIPTSEEGLIVNISKVDDPEELDPRFSRFTNGLEYDQNPGEPGAEMGPMDGEGPDPFGQWGGPGSEYDGDGFTDLDASGPDGADDGDDPESDGPGGPDRKQGPDGIQIQQGPEIRAEFSIPKNAEIDPKDIMSMIDNIVSGIAGKVGAEVRKVSGKVNPGGPDGILGPNTPGMKPTSKNPGEAAPDPFALYEFKDLQSVIQASKLLSMHYDSENVLYKNPINHRYYLYLGRERCSLEEFAKVCTTLNEFGSRCRISYATKEYFEEHMTVILRDALMQLEDLA